MRHEAGFRHHLFYIWYPHFRLRHVCSNPRRFLISFPLSTCTLGGNDETHTTWPTVFISVALAVIAVVVRFLAYQGVQMPIFPTGGFLILLIGYLVLLAGNLFEGA